MATYVREIFYVSKQVTKTAKVASIRFKGSQRVVKVACTHLVRMNPLKWWIPRVYTGQKVY